MDWFETVTERLLATAGLDFAAVGPADISRIRDIRDKVGGSLQRTVPQSDRLHIQGSGSTATPACSRAAGTSNSEGPNRSTSHTSRHPPTADRSVRRTRSREQ